jgi:alpha-beta hydrolase superfamily lysophospholipase
MRALGPVFVAVLPALLHAQSERALFLVRHGADTVAVETAWRGEGRAEGTVRFRAPLLRVRQVVSYSPANTIDRVVTTVGTGTLGDSALLTAELTLRGDSAFSHVIGAPAPIPDRRFAVPVGAVPFVDLSGLSLELILRRARTLGGDTARVPLLLVSGQPIDAIVSRLGKDSALISVGSVTLRARTDAVGRLLGAAVAAQNVVFERLAGDSPVAEWSPVPKPPSYAAPAGAPYTAEEVVVTTPAKLRLTGTLTMPARSARARRPAVVLITGSGAQDRDEATPFLEKWRPFREIADTLSRRGIAVLRLDDRGVGGSDAGAATATSADFADDVRAAVAWLRTRSDVDPARIGLVGHSEGAIIAPMVAASDPRLRAIALIAGTASRGRAILDEQRRYLFGADTALTPARRDSLIALAARETDSALAVPGWLRFFADYDPLVAARRVRVPTLILQGETDRQVPAIEARRLADAMRAAGNRRVTVRTFPRMNHLMVEDPSGSPLRYPSLPSFEVRQDLRGVLADWLARTL